MKDYFSILNLPRYASEEQIKEAYRRLAMRWHPDANPLDQEASGRMQDLNRAKEVLFDKETREEYKRVLDIQDQLSLDNLQKLRQKYKDNRNAESTVIEFIYPYDRRKTIVVIIITALIAGTIGYVMTTGKKATVTNDPIRQIIERHNPMGSPSASLTKTIIDTTVSPDVLERLASVAAMMGDYRTAAGYWEAALRGGDDHLSSTVNLSLAYIKLRDYPKAFSSIDSFAASAKDKLLVYATLGDYFKSELQPIDAKDAYRKAIEFAPQADTTNVLVIEALARARAGIVN